MNSRGRVVDLLTPLGTLEPPQTLAVINEHLYFMGHFMTLVNICVWFSLMYLSGHGAKG